jgi:hypothetical protein
MWDTSKIPTSVLTAMCSSRMPAYWIGISQPANGTSFAPAATCASCKGVRLRAVAVSLTNRRLAAGLAARKRCD